mmetsp:Transcript_12130/g.36979  ORF Transcript_12130/g.36979 Transcript_12130/m.36979 type:complete len:279 (-) Transcript_12130:120-956(-)
MLQQLCGRRAPSLLLQTLQDDVLELGVHHFLQRDRPVPIDDFADDLSRGVALLVRVLHGEHLQHTHSKGVDVDLLRIFLIVQLWGHKFGRTDHGVRLLPRLYAGEAQVTELHLANVTVDEDVVTLEVTVHNWWVEAVQVGDGLEDVERPPPDNLETDRLGILYKFLERARSHELRDEVHLLPAVRVLGLPFGVKFDDVLVVHRIQKLHLPRHLLQLQVRKPIRLQFVPGDLEPLGEIITLVDVLVRPLAEQLVCPHITSRRILFHPLWRSHLAQGARA